MTIASLTCSSRPMQDDADFWRMRDLLVVTMPITPVGFNWDVRRLDGKRFYEDDLSANRLLRRPVQLWEDADELVAFVLPESHTDAHLLVHPAYRHLEAEMIAWAEVHLAAEAADGKGRQLETYVYEYDSLRQRLLAERGFVKIVEWGMIRTMRLGKQPLVQPRLADGYTLRTTRPDDPADCQRIADLLNVAFGRTFHNALEYHNFAARAPSFCQELDLVAEASDGTLGAYVGIPYDKANHLGIFEPVCAHPDHRRLGLGRESRHGLSRHRHGD